MACRRFAGDGFDIEHYEYSDLSRCFGSRCEHDCDAMRDNGSSPSIDWSILIVIGSATGIGYALEQSQAASTIAEGILNLAGGDPLFTLAAVYIATMLCTELITNNAAAVLMFPIAINAASSLQCNPIPFVITLMIAASASFLSPFGYQTNTMVYSVGGYRVQDYLKFGLPLSVD